MGNKQKAKEFLEVSRTHEHYSTIIEQALKYFIAKAEQEKSDCVDYMKKLQTDYKEQFKEAFLTFDIPDDDYERARKNLDMAEMRERIDNYVPEPGLNFKYAMQEHTSRLYYIGQIQPFTILNPFAWAEFIKAWKEGKFKRKKE